MNVDLTLPEGRGNNYRDANLATKGTEWHRIRYVAGPR